MDDIRNIKKKLIPYQKWDKSESLLEIKLSY